MTVVNTDDAALYGCDGCGFELEHRGLAMPPIRGWTIGTKQPNGQRSQDLCPTCTRLARARAAAMGPKAPLELVPMHALRGVARVLAYGDEKHRGKWASAGPDALELEQLADCEYGAAMRHLASMREIGLESVDDESGFAHLDHAIARLMRLRELGQDAGLLAADPKPELRIGAAS